MILQYIYKPALNFIYNNFTYRLSESVRNRSIIICFILTFFTHLLSTYKFIYSISYDSRDYIMCLLLAFCIILSVNGSLEIINWQKKVYFPYTLTAVLLIFAGINHYIGASYTTFPLVSLVGFMCLYFVWGNRGDYDVLFEMLAKSYIFFASTLLLVCIFKHGYISGQEYTILGIYLNEFAKFMVPTLACLFYLLIRYFQKIYYNVFFTLMIGVTICIIYINHSRGGMLCSLVVCFVGSFLYYRELVACYNNIKCVIKKTLLLVVIITVTGISTFLFLQFITPVIDDKLDFTVSAESINFESDIVNENVVEPGSWEYVENEGRQLIEGNQLLLKANDILTDRVIIWAAYINNISWKGHDFPIYSFGPHNQFIELAYNAGALVGILWFISVITVGILLVYQGILRKTKCLYFPLLIFGIYFIFTMIDTGIMPFAKTFIYLYYVSLLPFMVYKNDSRNCENC